MELKDFPPRAYLQQLARAYRFRDRYVALLGAQSPSGDSAFNDLEDFLWATFQNLWHVKDWLFNDPSVDTAVARAAIQEAESNHSLLIAADMANGTKHYRLKNERVGAQDASIQFVLDQRGRTTCHHTIRMSDGSQLRAIDAIDHAFEAWREILTKRGLEYFADVPATASRATIGY